MRSCQMNADPGVRFTSASIRFALSLRWRWRFSRMFCHLQTRQHPNFSSRVIYYVGHLHGMLFFPLSGFLVFRPIVAQLLDQGPIPEARSFLRKRFWRIFPAYWLVLTLLLMV